MSFENNNEINNNFPHLCFDANVKKYLENNFEIDNEKKLIMSFQNNNKINNNYSHPRFDDNVKKIFEP